MRQVKSNGIPFRFVSRSHLSFSSAGNNCVATTVGRSSESVVGWIKRFGTNKIIIFLFLPAIRCPLPLAMGPQCREIKNLCRFNRASEGERENALKQMFLHVGKLSYTS